MYRRILVALENSRADDSLVPHIAELAGRLGSELVLIHVADGWAARHFNHLSLAESEEMKRDRVYLDGVAAGLRARALAVETVLALGNPPNEILRAARERDCDLIAMTAHGHKFVADFFLGSTIDRVRHNTTVPVLVVRAGGLRTGPPVSGMARS